MFALIGCKLCMCGSLWCLKLSVCVESYSVILQGSVPCGCGCGCVHACMRASVRACVGKWVFGCGRMGVGVYSWVKIMRS